MVTGFHLVFSRTFLNKVGIYNLHQWGLEFSKKVILPTYLVGKVPTLPVFTFGVPYRLYSGGMKTFVTIGSNFDCVKWQSSVTLSSVFDSSIQGNLFENWRTLLFRTVGRYRGYLLCEFFSRYLTLLELVILKILEILYNLKKY